MFKLYISLGSKFSCCDNAGLMVQLGLGITNTLVKVRKGSCNGFETYILVSFKYPVVSYKLCLELQ